MKEFNIDFTFNSRFYTSETGNNIEEVWFVLHGHGQLAQYFIRKFNTLDLSRILIVAPEGLSKYYLSGYTGRVGATWMTKEDRLLDIKNYVTYLNSVYDAIISELNENVKITVLGFSQGTATASRWVAQSKIHVDRLILWAGIFPPDMEVTTAKDRFDNIEVLIVYGNKDEFLNDEKFKEQEAIIQQLGISEPKVISFDGNHDIHNRTLQLISSNSYLQ